MESTSFNEITAFSGTLQNSAIFALSLAGTALSERQIRISGWIPIDSNSLLHLKKVNKELKLNA